MTVKAGERKTPSALEVHFAYYDRDGDGVIYPQDVYKGVHGIGLHWFLSILAVLIICGSFSWPTQDYGIPDPLFSIKIRRAHHCKHSSDSESYDGEGKFVPAKFDKIFRDYATEKDVLSLSDIIRMLNSNRDGKSPRGWILAVVEWLGLYWLAASYEGKLSKARVRACFTGRLWPILEEETRIRRGRKSQHNRFWVAFVPPWRL